MSLYQFVVDLTIRVSIHAESETKAHERLRAELKEGEHAYAFSKATPAVTLEDVEED